MGGQREAVKKEEKVPKRDLLTALMFFILVLVLLVFMSFTIIDIGHTVETTLRNGTPYKTGYTTFRIDLAKLKNSWPIALFILVFVAISVSGGVRSMKSYILLKRSGGPE